MRLTELAKDFIASAPLASPFAIDATAGNGHDTVFLARLVGTTGHVYAFDNQTDAIKASKQYLRECDLAERTTTHLLNHAEMLTVLPENCAGNIGACMFNLGYLPGSDHSHTTQTESTLRAVETCSNLLCVGGRISVVCYPDRQNGKEETSAVKAWFEKLDPKHFETFKPTRDQNANSPVLLRLTCR